VPRGLVALGSRFPSVVDRAQGARHRPMDLLARLRPRWRHPDPAVRAAAVRDLGAEGQDRLGAIADSDPDPHVRRLAITKLEDPALLERVAEREADPALRELAVERVQEVLVRVASSDGPLAECEAALARLTDARSLAAVAVAATHESVRRGALARASGDRVLRDIVRDARDPEIRRAALHRIHDPAALRSIALGGPPELALQALERIEDVASLHAIAGSRTAAKSLQERARALLASRSAEAPAVAVKEARARQLELCTAVHMLRTMPDVVRAAEQVREAQREWQALAREVEPRPDVAEPFRAACDAILTEAATVARRRADAEHAERALAEGLAARTVLCERVESLDGADVPRGVADAREAWKRLPPVPGEQGAELWHRFSLACEQCAARHREWLAAEALRADLTLLVEQAEALVDSRAVPTSKQWTTLERRWRARAGAGGAARETDLLERRFVAATKRLRQQWQEEEERRSTLEQKNLARLEALCARLQELATSEAWNPSAGRRELRAAEAALGGLGPLPPSERRAAWTERLSDARDQLLRRVSREEQTEEWRRWANVGAQEAIIGRVEALLESNDLAAGTRQLGQLQDEWARVATASADKSQALWERFRAARNELRRRCDAYLANNLEKKRSLCAQVAGLADSTAWNETAELIRRLQAEWKGIGAVPARHTAALWREFREPCDRFFARRKEHYDRLHDARRENAQRREALCAQAEALADSTDWDETAAAIKQLQAEWKGSGPPPRAQADALWQRFRMACDRFFDRRSRRAEVAREQVVQSAHAICDSLEALARSLSGEDGPAADRIGESIDQAWGEWVRLDLVTLDDRRELSDRLHRACEQIASARPEGFRGTRLDPDVTRKRREKLCARLEALVGPGDEPRRAMSPQEMALALRERLAANTIGGGAGPDAQRQDVAREVERLDASWAHLGPALDETARALADRFERARARLRAASR
jgi:hypothetical protein